MYFLGGLDIQECSCYAALAYVHAGDVDSVSVLLESVTEVNDLPLDLRALHSIVRVGLHIDCGTLETEAGRTECGRLENTISELRGSDTQGLLRRCAGTLGRALMHEYRHDKALPLLRSAVEYHGTTALVFERARSRIYLAMALRMNGNSEEAFGQVKLAEKDLEEYTRPFSAEYASSCRTYLLYEKARTLVSLGRMQEALDATDMALRGCEYQWWPQLGILRTRVWALRGVLREREADACVERMVAVRRNLVPPGPLEKMIDGLIEEAKGDRTEGGIVY
jgi:tetratricopeptide (TPR) repeat protein